MSPLTSRSYGYDLVRWFADPVGVGRRVGARGPVTNPVPSSRARRLAHRSPIESTRPFARARLRQKVAEVTPRAIPDLMWDELFAAMPGSHPVPDPLPRRRRRAWSGRAAMADPPG